MTAKGRSQRRRVRTHKGSTKRRSPKTNKRQATKKKATRKALRGYKQSSKKTSKKGASRKRASKKVRIHLTKGKLHVEARNGKPAEGYHIHLSTRERRRILRRVVEEKGEHGLSVFRRLIVMRTFGKNRLSTEQKTNLTADANYIKGKYYRTSAW
jgi:hypothetical protein